MAARSCAKAPTSRRSSGREPSSRSVHVIRRRTRWSCGSSSPPVVPIPPAGPDRSRDHALRGNGRDVPETLARVEAAGGGRASRSIRSAATRRDGSSTARTRTASSSSCSASTIPETVRIIVAGNPMRWWRREGRRRRRRRRHGRPRRGSLLAKEGKKVAIVERDRTSAAAAMAAPRPPDRPRLAPRRGPGRQPDPRLRARRRRARALRAQRLDAVLGPRPLDADPGVLRRRRQAGAQALHRGAGRDARSRSSTSSTTSRCASG